MVKMSPQNRDSKTAKHKPRLRSRSNKYLKPGALAQIRYSKAKSAPCAEIGKERIGGLDGVHKIEESDVQFEGAKGVADESPLFLSPVRGFGPAVGPFDVVKPNYLQSTPKTPSAAKDCNSESRLESLPMDLLIKIMCHLHHDQLKAVFHVSQRIRKAVVVARQFYFNYTTPDRSRQEMLRTMTPLPTEHWPFRGDGKGIFLRTPKTPKAPKHGPRPPSRIKLSEGPQIAAVLFQEPTFSARCMGPSALQKSLFKSFASNRVLFYEDELCHAVAQNKLR
ncbi:F-box protein At4g35930 isoform X2 [Apium graveolens]|uniref:F-box protein At4g35930 isoform X2 n=1 Tax=Apium graveolens TaxID=4045 RepID=UPI003D7BB9E4